jgi:hypothetical protein
MPNDFDLQVHPKKIAAGGVLLIEFIAQPGTYEIEWVIDGPERFTHREVTIALLIEEVAVTGPIECAGEPIRATLDTSNLVPGAWTIGVKLLQSAKTPRPRTGSSLVSLTAQTEPFEITPRPFAAGDDVAVTMKRTAVIPTADQALWAIIRHSTNALSFDRYDQFIDYIMCGDEASREAALRGRADLDRVLYKSLPFPDVDPYRLLKAATEVFMMVHCGADLDDLDPGFDLDAESRRLNRAVSPGEIRSYWLRYLRKAPLFEGSGEHIRTLPYLDLIRMKLGDVPVVRPRRARGQDDAATACYGILAEKLTRPCFLELIWSYWQEEGMLVQTLNAIAWRFQNRPNPATSNDPLAAFEIDPLRPLNNFLWGYIQDAQHRLTVVRRAYEYDHHYGLPLAGGQAVPALRGADSRSRFVDALHNLLHLCSIFYKEDDDTTVIADGFPVLNALKEVHLLLTEGAHNQYRDLPWTARQEMLIQQWLMSRPEMREFLPGRVMVAYPERWMDRVETMKTLQCWTDSSIMHFNTLAVFGEQILLGIRFGAWTRVSDPDHAANWARYWRAEVQGYIHSYRAVTGSDLTARLDATVPAVHLRHRLAERGGRRSGELGAGRGSAELGAGRRSGGVGAGRRSGELSTGRRSAELSAGQRPAELPR